MEFQKSKKIAPASAREILKTNYHQEHTKATDSWYRGRVDQADAAKNAKKWKDTIDKTFPETLDSNSKNFMWKRAKQLKDEFTEGMLSRDELHPVKGIEVNGTIHTVVDTERLKGLDSVRREIAWNTKNEKKLKEYKNIMRHLVPDDSGATDIERFRPIRHGK